ncbi:MAG: GDSL-type esterase/lipase family protein [Corynebacterium sp.]|nr:GDSL-type esterase/lipase family protein [Corynebacterium sp.]
MLRKVLAICTLLAAIVAGISTPNVATAQERNMVIFGDSVISDGNVVETLKNEDPNVLCVTSDNSYAEQAARHLGLVTHNYSCSGTITFSGAGTNIQAQMPVQVQMALDDGALNAATERVVLTVGFNDTYNNVNISDAEVRQRFVDAMVPQIERIRAAAPNARIQLVGYASITDQSNVCLFHVIPNIHDTIPGPLVVYWENQAQWMNVDLAVATGVEFVDLKPLTYGHSMCANDEDRYWGGLVDLTGSPFNMPVHLNQKGHEVVGEYLASI